MRSSQHLKLFSIKKNKNAVSDFALLSHICLNKSHVPTFSFKSIISVSQSSNKQNQKELQFSLR